jgi:hypothetical protein
MSQNKMTFGVIVGNRGFFPDHLAKSGREEMLKALETAGMCAVALSAQEGKYGAVETREEARRCADLFKHNCDRIDGLPLPSSGNDFIRVTPKKDWQPKTWEARDIEVPDDLLAILKIFPGAASWCSPIAKVTSTRPVGMIATASPRKPMSILLIRTSSGQHFATRTLQHADIKTVQKLLGHHDIESTMRYLGKAESKKVREQVNAVWA